jgi:hypothetical protein
MPGGAVLAAGGCVVLRDGEIPKCDDLCNDGSGCRSNEIFWIDRDANVSCCGAGRPACDAPIPEDPSFVPPPPFVEPALVGGADGRPWLGRSGRARPSDGSAAAHTLRRFDPWSGQFSPPSLTTDRRLSATARADGGLFVALDDCGAVDLTEPCSVSAYGFRHGLRGPYTQAVAPLLLADTEGTALDRAPGVAPAPGAVATTTWRDQSNGEVQITPGSALLLTDTTYEDVDIVIHVTAGPPPIVQLGSASFGKGSCQWPLGAPQAPFDAELLRKGEAVTLSVKGRSQSCDGPSGRVSIALSSGGPMTVESVAVTRIAD